MDKERESTDEPRTVKIGFPVTCHYRGGHSSLGKRGTHLWISKDKIGYGELRLTHGLPLSDVTSVDVKEREFGGSDAETFFAAGTIGSGRGGPPASRSKVMTDISVRTKDGQNALWVVEGRKGDWIRTRLTPALERARIPYYDDLPPEDRDPV